MAYTHYTALKLFRASVGLGFILNMGFVLSTIQAFPLYRMLKDSDGGFRDVSGRSYEGEAFVLDTSLKGNGNYGHSGERYGTALEHDEKRALIEYLKTT